MSTELTLSESGQLARHEERINQGMASFIEVGEALSATLRALERIEALLREQSARHVTRKEKARRMGVHPATLRRRERRAELKRMANF